MDKITQQKRLQNYHKIYECICTNSTLYINEISKKTALSRNTVAKYLNEMYAKNIVRGPYLEMKFSTSYKEYLYLMNFLNPQETFKRLKEFPYVLYHALTCGDWNTVIITNKLLDLSQSVGFQSMVYRDTKYGSYTPKVDYTTWDTCFTTINEAITHSTPPKCKSKNRSLSPALTWEKDQWKLFCAFKDNIRKKITPTLRGIGVRYKTYAEWFKSLQDHCTVCTGFYPHRYQTYLHWLFLLDSQYEESVTSLFRLVPATPVITEVGETLLLRIGVTTPHITRTLICALLDLHTKTVITHSRKAFILSEYIHPYTIL